MTKKSKISDLVFSYIESLGIKDVFLISGGGCIHLIDSISKNKKIKFICNAHEQASAIAAEAYARTNESLGVCLLTTGPGSTNALTGLIGAWLDSIPVLFISGQVKRETIADYSKLRQLGDQEINIIDMVKPVTKYAVTIDKPEKALFYLEKAVDIAMTGRKGPVWVNIPLDIQGSFIEKNKLKKYVKKKNKLKKDYNNNLKKDVSLVLEKFEKSKRPLFFVGNGVRLAGAVDQMLELINLLKMPVVTGFAGFDLVSNENKFFAGRPGTIGQRAGNFAVQNADVLLVIGSRLNIRMTGYNFKSFARNTFKMMVDIDREEMVKKTISIDWKLNYDAKDFIEEVINQLKKKKLNFFRKEWLNKIDFWKNKYLPVLSEYWQEKDFVNPYCFIDVLSKYLKKTDVLALSNATASICTYQALKFSQGTRILTNSGCASMGYGLPAGMGALVANTKGKTICIEGDGSIQMNIQEFQTIFYNKLPLKVFVYNNGGYVSIRLTQNSLFNGNVVASCPKSGVGFPDILKVAKAYGISTVKIDSNKDLNKKIEEVFKIDGPVVCEIVVSPDMKFLPKSASMQLKDGSFVSRPLEDMYPFLSREELKENMYIPLWEG
ncbi:MAG: thiamine pyrophosphate-binding protein [Candidatus Shapirobacteria bacterium]|nr:thiamine pyrophosphate-binding protein [Candidatus Shapirobacteria bacterium]